MGQRIKKGLKKAWEGITSNITASRKHEQEQEDEPLMRSGGRESVQNV